MGNSNLTNIFNSTQHIFRSSQLHVLNIYGHKKKNKYTVAFRIEISVLYISICIIYVHIKLESLRNKVGKSYNVYVFKVVK